MEEFTRLFGNLLDFVYDGFHFYAVAQIEYCCNFLFRRHFPIPQIFARNCAIGLWRLTANRIREIFGVRLNRRLHGKLAFWGKTAGWWRVSESNRYEIALGGF